MSHTIQTVPINPSEMGELQPDPMAAVLSQLDADEAKAKAGDLSAVVALDAPKPKRRGPAEVVIHLTYAEAFGLAKTRMDRAAEMQQAILAGEQADLNAQFDLTREAQALLAVADPESGLGLVAKVIR